MQKDKRTRKRNASKARRVSPVIDIGLRVFTILVIGVLIFLLGGELPSGAAVSEVAGDYVGIGTALLIGCLGGIYLLQKETL